MVFALVVITVLIFIAVDFILQKEQRIIKETEQSRKSAIFVSPEKSLRPLNNGNKKLYHLSHTWIMPLDEKVAYIGYDNFISSLFTQEVILNNLPSKGAFVAQGTKIWDIGMDTSHRVTQLAPVSCKIVDINPACKIGIALPTEDLSHSWVLKIEKKGSIAEQNNLMKQEQASVMNSTLRDKLYMLAQEGHYLNDGGEIDRNYISEMSQENWQRIVSEFFTYA